MNNFELVVKLKLGFGVYFIYIYEASHVLYSYMLGSVIRARLLYKKVDKDNEIMANTELRKENGKRAMCMPAAGPLPRMLLPPSTSCLYVIVPAWKHLLGRK